MFYLVLTELDEAIRQFWAMLNLVSRRTMVQQLLLINHRIMYYGMWLKCYGI